MATMSPVVQCISPYTFLLEFQKDWKSLICHLIYSYDPGASQLRTTFYSTHKNLNYSREQKWAELVERYRIDKASKTGYISDIRKEMHIDILVETVVSTPWAAASQLRTTLNSTHKCPSYSHEQYGRGESSRSVYIPVYIFIGVQKRLKIPYLPFDLFIWPRCVPTPDHFLFDSQEPKLLTWAKMDRIGRAV